MDLATRDDGEKHLVLVRGGPGTGKSVIATQALGELSRREIPSVHVTNSSSFTTVMRSFIARRRDPRWSSRATDSMFRLSHNWVGRKDEFRVAICDEAHRFRARTSMYPFLVSNRRQAEELMECVEVLVAFIDERQILRREEAGTEEYLRDCATAVGVPASNVHGPIELGVHFRSAGSAEYVAALDGGLYGPGPTGFHHPRFKVRVHDSIDELECALSDHLAGVGDQHPSRGDHAATGAGR